MVNDFFLMFVLGLAGSLHCVQMCGPLVLSFDLAGANRGVTPHLAYHSGRLVTYSILGLIAGWIGSSMNLALAISGIANRAAVIAGALMVVAGLILAGAVRSQKLVQIRPSSAIAEFGGRLLRTRLRFATGLVLGLLPCGLVYGALLKSVATASPVHGAVSMAGFALGTAGPLIGLGAFSSVITRKFRSQAVAGIGIALMGAFLVWRGLTAVTPACHLHHH